MLLVDADYESITLLDYQGFFDTFKTRAGDTLKLPAENIVIYALSAGSVVVDWAVITSSVNHAKEIALNLDLYSNLAFNRTFGALEIQEVSVARLTQDGLEQVSLEPRKGPNVAAIVGGLFGSLAFVLVWPLLAWLSMGMWRKAKIDRNSKFELPVQSLEWWEEDGQEVDEFGYVKVHPHPDSDSGTKLMTHAKSSPALLIAPSRQLSRLTIPVPSRPSSSMMITAADSLPQSGVSPTRRPVYNVSRSHSLAAEEAKQRSVALNLSTYGGMQAWEDKDQMAVAAKKPLLMSMLSIGSVKSAVENALSPSTRRSSASLDDGEGNRRHGKDDARNDVEEIDPEALAAELATYAQIDAMANADGGLVPLPIGTAKKSPSSRKNSAKRVFSAERSVNVDGDIAVDHHQDHDR